MRLRDAALGIAMGEAANRVREVGGNNRGPDVAKYLRSTDIQVPAAWCLAFLFWCSENGARLLECENPLRKVPLRALVASLIDTARAEGWIVSPRRAKAGDIVAFQWRSGNHVGILLDTPPVLATPDPPNVAPFFTVEGNTANDVGEDELEQRQREGDGVHVKLRRYVPGKTHFIRWDEARQGPRRND